MEKVLKKIGEGSVSIAYLCDDNHVLLVGKREDSLNTYNKLKANLDLLSGKIKSVKIQEGASVINACDEYPLGAFKFLYVPGTELKLKINTCTVDQKNNIGKTLAAFIFEMQRINVDLDKQNEILIAKEKLKKSIELLKSHLPENKIKNLNQVLLDYISFLQKRNFCLTHGDLQEENLLLDENNNLIGIIDFGNMEYYVPEVEFAPMMEYDVTIFNSMIENYNAEISVKNIKLISLVRNIRFFKHVLNWSGEAIQKEVDKICKLSDDYFQSNENYELL